MKCNRCGGTINEGDTYCLTCGNSVGQAENIQLIQETKVEPIPIQNSNVEKTSTTKKTSIFAYLAPILVIGMIVGVIYGSKYLTKMMDSEVEITEPALNETTTTTTTVGWKDERETTKVEEKTHKYDNSTTIDGVKFYIPNNISTIKESGMTFLMDSRGNTGFIKIAVGRREVKDSNNRGYMKEVLNQNGAILEETKVVEREGHTITEYYVSAGGIKMKYGLMDYGSNRVLMYGSYNANNPGSYSQSSDNFIFDIVLTAY